MPYIIYQPNSETGHSVPPEREQRQTPRGLSQGALAPDRRPALEWCAAERPDVFVEIGTLTACTNERGNREEVYRVQIGAAVSKDDQQFLEVVIIEGLGDRARIDRQRNRGPRAAPVVGAMPHCVPGQAFMASALAACEFVILRLAQKWR